MEIYTLKNYNIKIHNFPICLTFICSKYTLYFFFRILTLHELSILENIVELMKCCEK